MSKSTAQGSPDGPKYIFGKENVNWAGPKQAADNKDLQGDVHSVMSDFVSQDEWIRDFIENRPVSEYDTYNHCKYAKDAASELGVQRSEIAQSMESFINIAADYMPIEYQGQEMILLDLDDDHRNDIGDNIAAALYDDEDTAYYAGSMIKNLKEGEIIDYECIGEALWEQTVNPNDLDTDYNYNYAKAAEKAYKKEQWSKSAIIHDDLSVTLVDN